ncbi:hypothetical protein LIER_26586 [Lithospermum erythrorhizon]|uniref:Uncharacterized protein n=1 Tax=Lithospermum erythrorhizon TaxID=34254 RepID=A0AAV3RBY5_LITER
MARTKRTLGRLSLPSKRAKVIGGVKYAFPSNPASPSTSTRLTIGALSAKPSPDRAMYDTLTLLLDQGFYRGCPTWTFAPNLFMKPLDCGYSPLPPSALCLRFNSPLVLHLQAAFASRALGDGHTLLSQQTHTLLKALTQERLKVRTMEQELQELQTQDNNYP